MSRRFRISFELPVYDLDDEEQISEGDIAGWVEDEMGKLENLEVEVIEP